MDMQINIQLPPQGDATPEDVLETATFTSKGSYAKKKGKIRVINGFQSPTEVKVNSSGTVFMKATKGFYTGEGQVFSPIENLVSKNVKKGVPIGDMIGEYEGSGDIPLVSNLDIQQVASTDTTNGRLLTFESADDDQPEILIDGGTLFKFEATNVKPENVKKGVSMLGFTGEYEGSGGVPVEGNATSSDLLQGKTATTPAGVITGTIPDYTGWETMNNNSASIDEDQGMLFVYPAIPAYVDHTTELQLPIPGLREENLKEGVKVLNLTGKYKGSAPPFIYGLWGNLTKSTDTIREWTFFVDNVLFDPVRIFVDVNSDGSMRAKNPNSNNIILELINPFLMGLNGSDGENIESATTAGSNQYDWTTIWSTILEMEYLSVQKKLRFVVRAGIMSYGNAAKFEGNYPSLYVDRLQLLA